MKAKLVGAPRWIATAVIAVLLVLTGCSATPSAGVAVVVNGVTLTEAYVEDSIAAAAKIGELDRDKLRPVAVNYMITAVIARKLAAEKGVVVAPLERAQFLAGQPLLARIHSDPAGRGFIDDAVDTEVIITKLGAEALQAAVLASSVTVNPRYGSWSPANGSLLGDTGSLSLPAPSATPKS